MWRFLGWLVLTQVNKQTTWCVKKRQQNCKLKFDTFIREPTPCKHNATWLFLGSECHRQTNHFNHLGSYKIFKPLPGNCLQCRKSMLWANYGRNVWMMKNIITNTSYKSASYCTHSTASHDHKVNFTFPDGLTNGLSRFTTTKLYFKQHLKKEQNQWEYVSNNSAEHLSWEKFGYLGQLLMRLSNTHIIWICSCSQTAPSPFKNYVQKLQEQDLHKRKTKS